jgi:hypothetical protein
MAKKIEDMTRQELINFYTGELEGSMMDFDGYANKRMLKEAIASLQALREALSATLSSEFEFLPDEKEEIAEDTSGYSLEWHAARGISYPYPKE